LGEVEVGDEGNRVGRGEKGADEKVQTVEGKRRREG
jgi:hypothetical protein